MQTAGWRSAAVSAWILRPQPNPSAELRLFCLPHAGGDTWIFHEWHRLLPSYVEICPIRLPGRGSRIAEAPFASVAPLVEALGDALRDALDRPFAIFGHSMGALIGYELARYLGRVLGRNPAMLCVASCPAPHLADFDPAISHLSPYLLMDALRGRFGAGAELAGNPELMGLMLPVLRADLLLCETYRYGGGDRLACALSAYGGTADPWVDPRALEAWGAHTTGTFLQHFIAGDHFFPIGSRNALLGVLSRDLEWCML